MKPESPFNRWSGNSCNSSHQCALVRWHAEYTFRSVPARLADLFPTEGGRRVVFSHS